jgi:transposase
MKKENSIAMPVVNEHAAGIDIGSKSHYVAVGQSEEDVCKFNVYSKDNVALVAHLRDRGIKTVAMESTGSYWQTLYSCLQAAGFEVVLSNNYIKDPQRKTDTKDARWLQRLHSLGLLKGAFIPALSIERIRTYHRQRENIVALAASCQLKMQKALRLMNIRLDVALNDITGLSGMRMLEAIVQGERSGQKLASLAHGTVKKSKEEITDALQGQWKDEQLFILADELEAYKTCQKRIAAYDKKIEELLKDAVSQLPVSQEPLNKRPCRRKPRKNMPAYDVEKLSIQYFGVNLLNIEGVGQSTVMTFIAEVGTDISKFPTKKHFTSWLRLAPNNKKTGDKIFSTRTPKGKSIMANAFRLAANTISQRKAGVLKNTFVRIAVKKGRAAAITALARKLAEIFWIMAVKKVPYTPADEMDYALKVKANTIRNICRKMRRLNIVTDDLVFNSIPSSPVS